jgi:polyvinyl alcohol dehydrogenase (cytochrome)
VGPYKSASGAIGKALYFGDSRANAYAVDAETGQQIWVRKVDEHAAASITGAPIVYDGRVFVPVQGLREEGQGGTAKYPCCTFRGSLSALDASSGAVIWKTYTIDESRPRAKNPEGVQMWGPAGGGIWSAPTVDVKRQLVYVATGNGYADPPQPGTDAVIAFEIASGKIKWMHQATPNDSWVLGCLQAKPGNPACPQPMGPDHDFSASPVLTSINGRDLLVLPQKSGLAFALDPDKQGTIVWQYRIGQGSGLGGQWGGAVDAQNAYFGVADIQTPNPGGMRAVKLATGEEVWSKPPQPKLCKEGPRCLAAQGAALTVIPGAVLSSALDGGLRAYSTVDGSILWQFNTNQPFETVNGVKANGGGMDGPGPIVAGGMLFVNSGYGGLVGQPGNVLLAFAIE